MHYDIGSCRSDAECKNNVLGNAKWLSISVLIFIFFNLSLLYFWKTLKSPPCSLSLSLRLHLLFFHTPLASSVQIPDPYQLHREAHAHSHNPTCVCCLNCVCVPHPIPFWFWNPRSHHHLLRPCLWLPELHLLPQFPLPPNSVRGLPARRRTNMYGSRRRRK